MRNVLSWIRANPVTVVSAVVLLLSLGFLTWIHLQGSDLEARMAARGQDIKKLQSFMRQSVEIPPERPDDAPESISPVTINEQAIAQLTALYGEMNREYEGIFSRAVEVNQAGHHLLLDRLLPAPADPSLPVNAREEYKRVFPAMLGSYDAESAYPRLDAGMPPSAKEITDAIERVQRDFTASMRTAQMTEEDEQALLEQKKAAAVDLLRERAQQLHLYAQTDASATDFPFTLGAWSLLNEPPQLHQLWEGQLELWIQQDIAQAIAIANEVDNPDISVMEAPVKRLIRIEVLPGYVGLHNLGGAVKGGVTGSSSGGRGARQEGIYPAPAGGLTGSADVRVSDNFNAGPTGRVSNALYDIRHARLEAVVDSQQLPVLMEAIARVNFMTVLNCQLTDVDEYEAMAEGYIYGKGDAVKVEMVIETIWLREWTGKLMPPLVRQYVGIDEPTDLQKKTEPGGFMPGGGMFGGEMDPFGGGR
jgi:hypothetical protein